MGCTYDFRSCMPENLYYIENFPKFLHHAIKFERLHQPSWKPSKSIHQLSGVTRNFDTDTNIVIAQNSKYKEFHNI